MAEAFLSVSEVSKRLNVSGSVVYGLIENNRLGHIKHYSKEGAKKPLIRVPADCLREYIEQNTSRS